MTSKKYLTILIPTLKKRGFYLERLMKCLNAQDQTHVEIISCVNEGNVNIGKIRNLMLKQVQTPYCVFIDDDDLVADTYISDHIEMISMGVDVIGFKGLIFTDGRNPIEFVHKHGQTYETAKQGKYPIYHRPIMHINAIRTEIALKVGYPEKTFGEDKDYGLKLANSGLVTSAGFIDKVEYYYYYRTKK